MGGLPLSYVEYGGSSESRDCRVNALWVSGGRRKVLANDPWMPGRNSRSVISAFRPRGVQQSRRKESEPRLLFRLQFRPCFVLFRAVPVLGKGGFTETGYFGNIGWLFCEYRYQGATGSCQANRLGKAYAAIRFYDGFDCTYFRFLFHTPILSPNEERSQGTLIIAGSVCDSVRALWKTGLVGLEPEYKRIWSQ